MSFYFVLNSASEKQTSWKVTVLKLREIKALVFTVIFSLLPLIFHMELHVFRCV